MSSIARKPHIIKPERTLAMPRHLIFFDTETKSEELENGCNKQILKMGWACYYRREYGRHLEKVLWQSFNDSLSFWSFLYNHLQAKTQLWVISRNIVFDFTIIEGWKYLRQVGFKCKFFYNAGLTTVISVTGRFGSIVFLDSLNWFVESLEKTGERIGLPKLKIDFDNCTEAELSTYCHRDVEIELENFKLFIKFLQDNNVSRLCYTRGSTAFAAYLFGHYHNKIYIHNNEQAINLEREAYKGGRTECFYLGVLENENYYTVDVNSLYPFVMSENKYPVKYSRFLHNITIKSLRGYLKNNSVVAKVLVETDEPVYAVKRDRTLFPIGCFWAVLTTPELKYALEHNHIKEIKDAVVYEQADIFSSYVNRFYKLRQQFISEGKTESAEFCKKLLNSLYGKFGQKAEIWEKIGECIGEPDRTEDCFRAGDNSRGSIRYLLGEIFELKGHQECFDSFPAIPAHVAAFGRMYLYDIMKQVGIGNYFYCDTDSLIINEDGLCRLQNLIDNVVLGKLKVVSSSNEITIRGLKDYTIAKKTVIKGIRKNAVKISEGVYSQEVWPSFKGLMRSENPNDYIIKTQTKVLSRKYTKGNVAKNGVVTPFLYDESYILESFYS
jgi:hypothetical protein